MRNIMQMQGKTVLVTGASSGIGRETAILLSELGARVILAARNQERLDETRSRMEGDDHRIEPFDLAQADAIPQWVKRIVSECGPLSGLVHCAGENRILPLQITTVANFESLMHANLTSAVMLVKAFRQKGCASPGSSIVLLSSVAGIAGQPGITAYSASKGALIAFAKSAALELAKEGLRVNCIAPGYVKTEMGERLRDSLSPEQFQAIEQMHPIGVGTARDVAYASAFLISECGRWITGSTLVMDGGYTAH
jgi:NAD(P)-dependent dehydrogenase (short-subunit alcohol dehydrogenase family)